MRREYAYAYLTRLGLSFFTIEINPKIFFARELVQPDGASGREFFGFMDIICFAFEYTIPDKKPTLTQLPL